MFHYYLLFKVVIAGNIKIDFSGIQLKLNNYFNLLKLLLAYKTFRIFCSVKCVNVYVYSW